MQIYSDFTDIVTVKMGSDNGHTEFFKIDRYRGQSQLPGYDPDVSEYLNYLLKINFTYKNQNIRKTNKKNHHTNSYNISLNNWKI